MIDYILTLIISFIGVFLGATLALISPEELKAGEKYWKILRWVLLSIIIAVIIYFSLTIWVVFIVIILIILKIFKREYPALAFVLFLSVFEGFLFLAGALIFIYSLPEGTLQVKSIVKEKRTKKMIKNAFVYVFKNEILYLIFGFILLPFLLAYA